MKRRLRYFGLSFVALILCLFTLVSAMTATVSAVNTLDFGISGMASNRTLSASELFDMLYGEALTDAEKTYLDALSGITFVYNDAIPDSIVTTEYDGDTGTLVVSLRSYSFWATNGVKVEWIPKSATIGEKTLTFDCADGVYSCRFKGLLHSADFEMELAFTWNAVIPKEAADELYTKTYTDASAALTVITEYEDTLAAYTAAKQAFLAYEAYLQALEKFNYYTEIEKPAYDAAYAEYELLSAKYQQYCDKLAAYEAWQQYWAYQEFISDDVQTKYLAYQAYLKQVEPIKAKLNVLDILFTADSRNFNFNSSLMGPTVTQVVENKDLLIAAGAEESYINDAGKATEELRVLMQEYKTLSAAKYKSEHDKITALYDYYTDNYKNLSSQFTKLYRALNYLGGKSAVIAELSRRGKLEHYYQFVGQLYITQACLQDAETLTDAWMIGGNKLAEVVESKHILTDTNTASPSLHSMPEVEVPKVEKVEQISRPTVEEVRTKPRLSDFGLTTVPTEPTRPAEVKKPAAVTPASAPGDAPAEPKLDSRLRAIAEELRQGTLKKRTARGTAQTLSLSTVADCPVSIRNFKTVTFYSADGRTVLDRQTLEYGSRVEYKGETDVRNRESDARYYYTFLGWVIMPEGTAPEMVVYDNMSLYAYYLETPRFYTVTWILDGETKTEQVPFGTQPKSPFITDKDPTQSHTYTFSGWEPSLTEVTEDVTYTGSFLSELRTYTVTWVVGDRQTETELTYGEIPVFEGETAKEADDYRYDFTGWDHAVTSVSEDVTYVAEYRKTALATDEQGKPLSILHTEDTLRIPQVSNRVSLREAATLAQEGGKRLEVCWDAFTLVLEQDALAELLASRCREIGLTSVKSDETGKTYRVAYLNSAGIEVSTDISATLFLSENSSGGMPVGYLSDGDTEVAIPESGQATVMGAFLLRVCDVYGVQVQSNEPVNLTRLPLFVESGKKVDLSLIGLEFGYEIASATVVLEDGSRETVTGTVFTMPLGKVTLELQIQKIVYRVSFLVDGKVISSAEYGLGETILLPESPSKATDELYSYQFSGWSPEVGIAYGEERELVFEATFTTKPVGRDYDTDRTFFYTLLWIGIGAVLLVGAAVTVTVILLHRRKKRRGGKKNVSKRKNRPKSYFDETAVTVKKIPEEAVETGAEAVREPANESSNTDSLPETSVPSEIPSDESVAESEKIQASTDTEGPSDPTL